LGDSQAVMPIRILIADDSDAARARLTDLLNSHAGWEVQAAVVNGQEAVVKSLEIKPDIVILDLAMPVMDGLRATREILKELPSVPILIYTFHGGSDWLEVEAKKAGARKVIAKPDVQLLLSNLESLLEREFSESRQVESSSAAATDPALENSAPKFNTSSVGTVGMSAAAQAETGEAISDPPVEGTESA
jgi:chemotaxis response regulator CheB